MVSTCPAATIARGPIQSAPIKKRAIEEGPVAFYSRPGIRKDLWVLNPKNLSAFIAKEPVTLKPEVVALAASRLALHVRSHE